MNIQGAYHPHRDLLELLGLERPACSNTLVPRGSHHMSSLWSPVVATNRFKRLIAFLRRRCEQTVPSSWLDEPPADPDIGVREPPRPRPNGGAGPGLPAPPPSPQRD